MLQTRLNPRQLVYNSQVFHTTFASLVYIIVLPSFESRSPEEILLCWQVLLLPLTPLSY